MKFLYFILLKFHFGYILKIVHSAYIIATYHVYNMYIQEILAPYSEIYSK